MVFGVESTTVSESASAVTPMQAVQDNTLASAVSSATDVLGLVAQGMRGADARAKAEAEAAATAAQSDLEKSLVRINQAIRTGGMTAQQGRMKAFQTRDAAIASGAVMAKDADKSFDAIFGGVGGQGGSLELTVEEKAAQAHRENKESLLQLGFSPQEAENALQIERQAKLSEAKAKLTGATEDDILAAGVANVGLVYNNLSMELSNRLKNGMPLSSDELLLYKDSARVALDQVVGKINQQMIDKGAPLSADVFKQLEERKATALKELSSRIDNWSEAEVMAKNLKVQDLRGKEFIAKYLPVASLANLMKNPAAGEAVIDFVTNPESRVNQWLVQSRVEDMLSVGVAWLGGGWAEHGLRRLVKKNWHSKKNGFFLNIFVCATWACSRSYPIAIALKVRLRESKTGHFRSRSMYPLH